jgi:hypothetical protein
MSKSESRVCSEVADITMTRDEALALFARREKAIYDLTGMLVQVGLLKAKPA